MPVTEMELNEALNRAAALMSPEGQRRIEYADRRNKTNYNMEGDFVQPSESYHMRNTRPQMNENIKHTSGLPKAILESMHNNVIDEYGGTLSSDYESVLDNIKYKPAPRPQQKLNEESYTPETYSAPQPQYYPPQQQYYVPQPQIATVDYNYIRSIVNECIQANMQKIKEELLNESSLKVIRLGSENKIQLIDNKNNLYESKLEYRKNISKK
jgi:hypothetical protein